MCKETEVYPYLMGIGKNRSLVFNYELVLNWVDRIFKRLSVD